MSEGNNRGAPTKYKEEYAEQVYKLCLLGADDKRIADFFNVCEATINNWKLEYPDFLESIKNGKLIADTEIANSLHNRAKGCKLTVQQAIKITTKTPYIHPETGAPTRQMQQSEEVVIVDLVQELPPDTTAAIFWLKNRQPAKWRDKHEVEQTVISEPVIIKWSNDNIPDTEAEGSAKDSGKE